MRKLLGDDAMELRLREWAREIESRWRQLSDGERVTLMALCCTGCGTLKLPCHACREVENDE